MTETVGLVQQFVERSGQLYSLPAVAAEVLRLTSEPRTDGRALRECVERDPALATRLLRVVNSSLFGLSRQITDLGQALPLIGIRPLKMLVLGFSLPRELFAGLEGEALSHYWRRTLIKALAARELAEKCWHVPGDEPFMAGLVQDIGVLTLIQQLGHPYQQFLAHVREHGGNLLEHELETLGFDHLVLSARMLRHWGFPESLCGVIAVPLNEERVAAVEASDATLARILHLADLVAQLIERPYGSALQQLLTSGGRYCGLTYETLQPLVASLHEKVGELASVLALELPEGVSYLDLLLTARERLAEQTLDAAAALAAPTPEDELLRLTTRMREELAAAVKGRTRRAIPTQQVESPANRDGGLDEGSAGVSINQDDGSGRAAVPATTAVADSRLVSYVAAAVQRCRLARQPITLALFEIDRFRELMLQVGPLGANEFAQRLRRSLSLWTGAQAAAEQIDGNCFAVVFEGLNRNEAVCQVRQAVSHAKPQSRIWLGGKLEISLRAGVATLGTPPKNYPAHELIEAAERCLSTAQLAGGDTVKSIEV